MSNGREEETQVFLGVMKRLSSSLSHGREASSHLLLIFVVVLLCVSAQGVSP
jgi:hypothetical protein